MIQNIQVGEYTAKNKIDAHGVMTIFAGHRTLDKLPVSIHLLHLQHLSDPAIRSRLKREFHVAGRVNSPYTIKYLDLVETDDVVAIITEPLPSLTLRAYLSLASKLSVDNVIKLIKQVAEGLNACHLAGVVHRNVTPENIYIDTRKKKSQIANFGLSSISNATTLTMTGTMVGSPEYAPPENLYAAPRDIRGDIYSLGIICWEMLTGHNPFAGNNITEIIQKKNEGQLPDPSAFNSKIPRWIDLLVKQMTAADPSDRMTSIDEVIIRLHQKTHITDRSENKKGHCIACGYPLPCQLYFCPYCGKSEIPATENREKGVLVITNVTKPEETKAVLEDTFSIEPSYDIDKTLKKTTINVIENTTLDENKWLLEKLHQVGCTTEIRPMSAWYYKMSSVILFCLLTIIYIMRFIRPLDYMYFYDTIKFLFIKTTAILFIACIIYWYSKLHYINFWKIPQVFFTGAMQLIPLTKYMRFHLVLLSTSIIIFGTAVLCYFSAMAVIKILQVIILRFIFVKYDPAQLDRTFMILLDNLNSFSFYEIRWFSIWVILPVVIRIFVGQIHIPPLYSYKRNKTPDNSKGAYSLHQNSEFVLLERFRALVTAIEIKEFRYIIAEGIENFLHFQQATNMAISPFKNIIKEFKKQITATMNEASAIGEQVRLFSSDAAKEAKTNAEKLKLQAMHQIAQTSGPPDRCLTDELKKAHDMLLRYETAIEIIHEYLNRLRMLVGSMNAATIQLATTAAGDTNMEDFRISAAILSETLKSMPSSIRSITEKIEL